MKLSTILITAGVVGGVVYVLGRRTKADELKEIIMQNNIIKKELNEVDIQKLITLLKSVQSKDDVEELNKAMLDIFHDESATIFLLMDEWLTEEEQKEILKLWNEKNIVQYVEFHLDEEDKAAIKKLLDDFNKEAEEVKETVEEEEKTEIKQ